MSDLYAGVSFRDLTHAVKRAIEVLEPAADGVQITEAHLAMLAAGDKDAGRSAYFRSLLQSADGKTAAEAMKAWDASLDKSRELRAERDAQASFPGADDDSDVPADELV